MSASKFQCKWQRKTWIENLKNFAKRKTFVDLKNFYDGCFNYVANGNQHWKCSGIFLLAKKCRTQHRDWQWERKKDSAAARDAAQNCSFRADASHFNCPMANTGRTPSAA